VHFGMSGWRVALLALSATSLALALLAPRAANDPRRHANSTYNKSTYKLTAADLLSYPWLHFAALGWASLDFT
jgi:hypothetical protein